MVRISKKKIKRAIEGSGGIVTTIARRLGRARETTYQYINKNPDIKQALDDEREKLVDVAESNLILKLEAKENWATSMVLRTLGKSRGYTEGVELKGELKTKIPTPSEVLEEIRKKREKV